MTTGGAGLEWFISSDMFYVEVVLEPSGNVKDVKIHHDGKTERQVSSTNEWNEASLIPPSWLQLINPFHSRAVKS